MDRIVNYIVSKRRILFFITSILIVLGGLLSSTPSYDGNIIGFDLKGNEFHNTSLRINEIFGRQNEVYIKITPNDDILKNVLSGVRRLEDNLKAEYPKSKIISLRPFYFGMFYKPKEKNISTYSFLQKGSNYPILNDLISNDKKSFLVVISVDSLTKFSIGKFNSIIQKPYTGISKLKAISLYHIEDTIKKHIQRDFFLLSVIIIVFFILFYLFIYRNITAIIFSIFIIGISLFSSIFFFSLFHIHLNLVTVLVIPVVLVLSLSDSIHLLNGYILMSKIQDKEERTKKVINHYIIPSFFSSATTSAAFFTFYFFNDSVFIREFGLITGLCLMAEFFLTFLMAPFLLNIVNVKKIYGGKINWVGTFLEKKQKSFAILFIIIFITSFFFINKLNFINSSQIFFPKDSELYATHEEFNKDFYSQMKLDILIERRAKSHTANVGVDIAFEKVVNSISKIFHKTNGVVRVNSATENYKVKSLFGISYNFLDKLGDKNPYYNKKKNIYRIELKVNDPKVIGELSRTIFPILVKKYPEFKFSQTSSSLIMDYVNKRVSGSLINSLLTSCFAIIIMIFLLTRSIGLTLASLLPNLVPLSFIIFIYVFLGLEINILTAITAVVCLGLLDDDTIHILYRRLWLKEPLEELSFSILSASIILAAGFGMFYFSSFEPTQIFGIVSASIFIFGVICELTLMPWIINFWLNKIEETKRKEEYDK